MKEKRSFIDAMLKQSKPFRELCREYGISEKTGYKWRKRFLEQGYAGLEEESRAPQKHPNALDGDTAAELIALRLAHPSWGGRKLLVLWQRSHPNQASPSLSSVNRILEKAKLLKKKRIHKASVSSDCPRLNQMLEAHEPNDVWCIDFKGWWRSDGELCEPFTVRDKRSRKVLCARLMTGKTAEHVRPVMTELFRKYGLPRAIHSDNGTPFAATNGILGLTRLSAWWSQRCPPGGSPWASCLSVPCPAVPARTAPWSACTPTSPAKSRARSPAASPPTRSPWTPG